MSTPLPCTITSHFVFHLPHPWQCLHFRMNASWLLNLAIIYLPRLCSNSSLRTFTTFVQYTPALFSHPDKYPTPLTNPAPFLHLSTKLFYVAELWHSPGRMNSGFIWQRYVSQMQICLVYGVLFLSWWWVSCYLAPGRLCVFFETGPTWWVLRGLLGEKRLDLNTWS